jgi:hypothetical protein
MATSADVQNATVALTAFFHSLTEMLEGCPLKVSSLFIFLCGRYCCKNRYILQFIFEPAPNIVYHKGIALISMALFFSSKLTIETFVLFSLA